METQNSEKIARKITKLILTNQQKMVKEDDIRNLCEGSDFNQVINSVYLNLKNIGFELIKTKFLEDSYYVLTTDGKDDNITPSQYGILALLLALSKEIDENIKLDDVKELFSEVWDTDVVFLIENDYIRKIDVDDYSLIKITPLGKGIFKNIIQNINLKSLLNIFENSES